MAATMKLRTDDGDDIKVAVHDTSDGRARVTALETDEDAGYKEGDEILVKEDKLYG